MEGYEHMYPEYYDYLQPPPDPSSHMYNVYDPQNPYGESYGLEELYREDYAGERKPSRHQHKTDTETTTPSISSSSGSTSTIATHPSEKGTNAAKNKFREPSFLDAFRVLYLEDAIKSKSPNQYLMTKTKRSTVNELLKRDGLGSKRWFSYPRQALDRGDIHELVDSASRSSKDLNDATKSSKILKVARSSSHVDRRVKVEGEFLRKYKIEGVNREDAPAAKLKPWELILYKKLGFIQVI